MGHQVIWKSGAGRSVAACALAAVLGACGSAAVDRAFVPHYRVLEVFGGEGQVKAVDSPGRVEAWQLDPAQEGVAPPNLSDLRSAGDVVVAEPITAKELSAVAMDPNTYDAAPKVCPFRPEAALRFVRGEEETTLVLSFFCRQAAVYRNGEIQRLVDIDPSRERFLVPLKRVLVKSSYIQGLPVVLPSEDVPLDQDRDQDSE